MKKNVAGQKVGAQMLTAADGSAFTGAVTVFVTIDAGTQAQGSVGSGACAHEGNGFHTYAPAQAETNGDHVAFTFTGTAAAPASVQVWPTFPQTGDTFARLGAPAGASVSADVAAVAAKTTNLPTDPADQSLIIAATDAITTAIAGVQADTDNIQTRLPAALVSGRIDASVGAMGANVMTAAAAAADLTTELQTGLATSAALAAVAAALAAVAEQTALIPAAPAAVGDIPTAAAIADAVHDEAVDGAVTLRQSVRLQNSVLAGKSSGLGTATPRFRDLADTKDRIVGTADADGNRTAVTRDAS